MLTNSIDIHNINNELGTKNVNDKIDSNSQNSKLKEIKEAKETKEEPLNINNTKCPLSNKAIISCNNSNNSRSIICSNFCTYICYRK